MIVSAIAAAGLVLTQEPPGAAAAAAPPQAGPSRPPSNPKELLENIKAISKTKDLLELKTYENQRLFQIFGGSKIDRGSVDSQTLVIRLSRMGNLFQNSQRLFGIGAEITIYTRADPNAAITKAKVVMDTGYDTRLTAREVIAEFGDDYALEDDPILRRPNDPDPRKNDLSAFQRPTNELGNRIITYHYKQSGADETISFKLNNDGTVRTLSLVQLPAGG